MYSRIIELQTIISKANNEIIEIRKNCKHVEFENVPYSYRVGSISNNNVCKFCGSILSNFDNINLGMTNFDMNYPSQFIPVGTETKISDSSSPISLTGGFNVWSELPMKRYVVGIVIQNDDVVLIQKQKPSFLKGKWNFPGGHIEVGETPVEAIVREFYEETGVATSEFDWNILGQEEGIFNGDEENKPFSFQLFNCHYINMRRIVNLVETTTEEKISVFNINDILELENKDNFVSDVVTKIKNLISE